MQRFSEHKTKTKTKNGGRQCPKLYNAIRKYGETSFNIELIMEAISKQKANSLEDFYIEKNDSINNGYNIKIMGAECLLKNLKKKLENLL